MAADDDSGAPIAETSKQGRTRKRKTREESNVVVDGAKPAKRVRGKRGSLKMLVEMPMDILYEIFGQLNPIDVLHVARTTKNLRALLMSRSSVTIWKSARANIVGLPDCPDDLSEPQYAALMFSTRCSFCQRDLSIVHISWYARVRCCNTCLKSNFTPSNQWAGSYSRSRGYPGLLVEWVPFVMIMRETHNRKHGTTTQRNVTFIWNKIDQNWKKEYQRLADPQSKYKWLTQKMEQCYAIQKHARACALWHSVWKNNTNIDEIESVFERDAEIMSYVKEIGFEEEVYKSPPGEHPLDLPALKDLWKSPGPIDEPHLAALKSLTKHTFNQCRRSRQRQEHIEFFTMRKPFLAEIYNNGIKTLPINSPYPNLAETYRIAEQHDLVDYSKNAADALSVPFDEVVALWRQRVDEKLFNIFTDAYGAGHVFDPTTAFDLAVAIFSCSECAYGYSSRQHMRHDAAMVHPCSQYPTPDTPASQRAFRDVFGDAKWADTPGSIEIRSTDLAVMQKVVEMCGLDPKVATTRKMNELNPIFECRACNSPDEGRATMTWDAVLQHQISSHKTTISDLGALKILEEPIASKVRERIAEDQERATFKSHTCPVVCPHCKSMNTNIAQYRRHLKDTHNILKFKYEDLVFSFKESRIPSMFRLWPPRDENDSEDELWPPREGDDSEDELDELEA